MARVMEAPHPEVQAYVTPEARGLPEEVLQLMERSGRNPFAPRHFRKITTNVLEPHIIKKQVEVEEAESVSPPPPDGPTLGELYIDPTSPESLAPWLLLLDANSVFVIHMVDPQTNYVNSVNPLGKVPLWIDSDGSCIWESSAIMRFICLKHRLDPHFYATNNLDIRTRTNMALDWATKTLFPHIRQALDPTGYERSDATDIPTAKLYLDMDFNVLTDFFLREIPFIGGEKPNIADYVIGMQCLMLFATDYPLFDTVRSYLYNIAEHSENWNEVTGTLRDHCAYLQTEHRALEVEALRKKRDTAGRRSRSEELREAAEEDEKRRQEDALFQQRLDEEREQREAQYRLKRDDDDEQMRQDWQRLALIEDARRKAEEDEVNRPEIREAIESMQHKARMEREEEEQKLRDFRAKQEQERAELEALEAARDRQPSTVSIGAKSGAASQVSKVSKATAGSKPKQGARKKSVDAGKPPAAAGAAKPKAKAKAGARK